jgi:ethanolamine utilization protein EutQ (cupin superfamily)
MRAPKGETTTFEFAYDGKCTVRSDGDVVTAEAGEVIYLAAGTPGVFHTDEDTDLVYVASSPYGEVNRMRRRRC